MFDGAESVIEIEAERYKSLTIFDLFCLLYLFFVPCPCDSPKVVE